MKTRQDRPEKTDDEAWTPPPRSSLQRSRGPGLGVLLVLVVLALGAFAVWRVVGQPRGTPAAAPESPPAAAAADTSADAGLDAPAAPMLEGDTRLQDWAKRLSSSPELLAWLTQQDVLRRLVAAVNLVADGESPRAVLSFLGVSGKYEVVSRDGALYPAPESAARYDRVAAVVASVDLALAAQAYGELRPYLESAYREVGRPGQSFHPRLLAALDRLIRVEIPALPPALVQREDGLYAYVDADLEALKPAEKHLLRMGPDNARAVQGALRQLREKLEQGAAPR